VKPVQIAEDGLLLRSWRSGDAEAVYQACRDPEIQRWTGLPSPYRRRDAETFVTQTAPRRLAAESAAHVGVFDPATGALLGACVLGRLELAAGSAEVGYWTAAPARGRGVAERATRVLARWAFAELGVRRLGWRAPVGNHASRLVALRVGFQLEGVLRHGAQQRDGSRVDAWIGSLLPDDLTSPAAGTGAMTGRAPVRPAGPGSRQARRAKVFGRPQPVLTAQAAGGPIRLRPPIAADLDAIVAACQDPESIRWTTIPRPYARGDAEFFVGPHAQGRWARGDGAVYAIAGPGDAYAGAMELRMTADPDVADVGFLVAPHARGRGYAPAALRAVCAWGFDSLGLARVQWRAYVGNDGSLRVAQKAGFTVEGVTRAGLAHRSGRRDTWVGSLLPADLEKTSTVPAARAELADAVSRPTAGADDAAAVGGGERRVEP
jgi:RimJ/RimL family protein N-acetyltransferase